MAKPTSYRGVHQGDRSCNCLSNMKNSSRKHVGCMGFGGWRGTRSFNSVTRAFLSFKLIVSNIPKYKMTDYGMDEMWIRWPWFNNSNNKNFVLNSPLPASTHGTSRNIMSKTGTTFSPPDSLISPGVGGFSVRGPIAVNLVSVSSQKWFNFYFYRIALSPLPKLV